MNLLSAKTFAQINGILSALLAIVGFVMPNLGLFTMEMGHTVTHVLIAIISLYFGYGNASADATAMFAKVFGAVYLLLGVVGFLSADLFGLGTALNMAMEMPENVLHLILGAWGLAAGFKND